MLYIVFFPAACDATLDLFTERLGNYYREFSQPDDLCNFKRLDNLYAIRIADHFNIPQLYDLIKEVSKYFILIPHKQDRQDTRARLPNSMMDFIRIHAALDQDSKQKNIPQHSNHITRPSSSVGKLVHNAPLLHDLSLAPAIERQVLRMIHRSAFNIAARAQGKEASEGLQNILISGPPGTGKTTLAQSLALALLDSRPAPSWEKQDAPVLLVKAFDLIGQYVGHSAGATKEALASANGGVLIIDEIDAISGNKFEDEVIGTLNAHMTAAPNQPIVIGTLYQEGRRELSLANRGLLSRFRHAVALSGQTDDSLTSIFKTKMATNNWSYEHGVPQEVSRLISQMRKSEGPNFGHIRSVENIIESIFDIMTARGAHRSYDFDIKVSDIPFWKDGVLAPRPQERNTTSNKENVVALYPAYTPEN